MLVDSVYRGNEQLKNKLNTILVASSIRRFCKTEILPAARENCGVNRPD